MDVRYLILYLAVFMFFINNTTVRTYYYDIYQHRDSAHCGAVNKRRYYRQKFVGPFLIAFT
uniref:Uncharacterized protein n=1 Tax=Ascaris lumbricoides TaxID=6252 RepID=A0A0M3IBQ7_ASCLU